MRYAKYKPTGIAWLPEVPEGWEMVRVRSLFEWRREKNNPIKSEERLSLSIDKGVTRYSEKTTNLDRFKEDFTEYLLAYPNDIVLNSMNMIVGAVGKSRYFGCVSPAYYVIRLRDCDADIDYYSLLLNVQAIRDVYHVLGRGICAIERGNGRVNTCRLKVPYNSFAFIPVPHPPLPTQHVIVAYLDEKCGKVDRLVAAKENEVALLKELKQSMIAEVVTRGVRLKRRLVPSGIPWLPEVPEGWEMKRLKWILEEIKVLSTTGEELPLSLTATDGLIPFSEKANRTMESATYVGAKIVRKGQIVFNRFKARLFAVAPCTGLVSSDYAVYQVRIEVEKKFLLYLFATPTFRQVMNNQASGIGDGFSRLYSSELFKLYVPLPPLVEQREIVAHIEARAAKIDAAVKGLEREVAALKEYKQRLIADVVTGQRKVA